MAKLTPFNHVDLIYKGNSFSFGGDDGYSQYVINKELSKNGELIDIVNLVQQYQLENKFHFKVMNTVAPSTRRPGFKQFPWIWKGSTKVDDIIKIISIHFSESIENSKTYYEILSSSKEGKEKLKWLSKLYGLENEK
jgi:hypothetical protein